MKADITRSTFRRDRHYSGVRLQQGRVQLDADFNEQVDIEGHRDRTVARDVVGPSGAPDVGGGFRIGVAALLSGVGFSGQVGVVVGERGTALVTTDGGASWALADLAASRDLLAVSVADDTHAYAVGAAATLRTADPTAGATWTKQKPPKNVTADLRSVHFTDADNGVAVGTGATIVATADGGATWSVQDPPAGVTDDLNGVHFPAPGVGFAVGDAGRILAFSGNAWTSQSAPEGFAANLRAVRFASAQVGWTVGDGGAILATTDGGAHWVEQAAPLGVTGALRALDFESADVVWAAGDDAAVVRSTDGGATWTALAGPDDVAADLYGLAVRPGSAAVVAGDVSALFTVPAAGAWTPATVPAQAHDLSISAGRIYVDGVLCENERPVRYRSQPDYPDAPDGVAGPNLVYLDVWQRNVTALEDPGIREVALGGPDTATRTRTVWQVKLADPADVPAGATCRTLPDDWAPASARSTGRLRARAEPAQIQTDECMVPAGGGYRRLENQLYRVEIHEPGTGAAATYKWSRDNGSIVARLEAVDPKSQNDFTSGELTISEAGRDEVTGFGGATYVELSDEGRVLRGEPGLLLEVDTVTGKTIKWKDYAGPSFSLADFPSLSTVRRWEGVDRVDVGQWHELEAGVWVELDGGDYRTGDYWTIPARTRTAAVEWPTEDGEPVFQPRQGIEHSYVALSFAQLTGDLWSSPSDCRELFPPLTGVTTMVMVGGEGQEAMPGNPLPQLLEVGVFRGRLPLPGTVVRFATTSAAGKLAETIADVATGSASLDVTTGADGIARCAWLLDPDPTKPSQQTRVELLDGADNPLPSLVEFNGSLSIAAQVAYTPTQACPDLKDATTVQAAIDTLCQRPTGGGCAVTVTPDANLVEVVRKLIDSGTTDLCVCLTAGDHKLADDLVLDQEGLTFELSGCGPGTRVALEGSLTLSGLDAAVLRDLELHLVTDRPLAFENCARVTIADCEIDADRRLEFLCGIAGAQRISIARTVLDAHADIGQNHPIPDLVEFLQRADRRTLSRVALEFATRLVESPDARAGLVKAIGAAGDQLIRLTVPEQMAYATLAQILAPDQVDVHELAGGLVGLFNAAAFASGGVALVLGDGGADTDVAESTIVGSIGLYGVPGGTPPNPDQLKLLSGLLGQNTVLLAPAAGTLRVRNSSFVQIAASARTLTEIAQAVAQRSGRITRLYRALYVTDCIVTGGGQSIVAWHAVLDGNDFQFGVQFAAVAINLGSEIANSAITTGNHALITTSLPIVARSHVEATNLGLNVVAI